MSFRCFGKRVICNGSTMQSVKIGGHLVCPYSHLSFRPSNSHFGNGRQLIRRLSVFVVALVTAPSSRETPHGAGQVGEDLWIGEQFHARHWPVLVVPFEEGLDGPVVPAPLGVRFHLGHGFGTQYPVG